MKIVYCIPSIWASGGMERVLSVKANWLVRHGYDVSIITTDQKNKEIFFDFDDRIHRIDLGINYCDCVSILDKLLGKISNEYRHRKALEYHLNQIKADVVISMYKHEMSFLPKIKDGSKKLLEYHFSLPLFDFMRRKGIWGIYDDIMTSKDFSAVKKYDRFIVLTEEDKKMWMEQKHVSNIEVVCNPLTFQENELSDCSSKTLISVGRLAEEKNFPFLIDVWECIKKNNPKNDWQLRIFGEGHLKDQLQYLINEKRLGESIYLEGVRDDLSSEYLNSSIFCLTSLYEGVGIVLLEAMHFGLPVVTTDFHCGPRDFIENGKNGYMVKTGDVDSMARLLQELMNNEAKRKEMGANAANTSKRFNLDDIMSKWEQVFSELVNS